MARRTGLRACVSGSFRRTMTEVAQAVEELQELGVTVLSPADPTVVGAIGEFKLVASDKVKEVRLVQERHMQAIASSDFLWLVDGEGYVGLSAAFELGCAYGQGVPVFATEAPKDMTLREFVTVVGSLQEALARVQPVGKALGVLVDPVGAIEEGHRGLERLAERLAGRGRASEPVDLEVRPERLVGRRRGRG